MIHTECGVVPARSYIPEPKRKPRKWAGKADEQKAVYGNRRRVRGTYGKRLLKKRGELIERSFAHCYETGGMRRLHLRGRENILRRQLIHVGAFNLSLILQLGLGAETPRELHNRQAELIFAILCLHTALEMAPRPLRRVRAAPLRKNRGTKSPVAPRCRRRISGGSATGC
jgi:transposase